MSVKFKETIQQNVSGGGSNFPGNGFGNGLGNQGGGFASQAAGFASQAAGLGGQSGGLGGLGGAFTGQSGGFTGQSGGFTGQAAGFAGQAANAARGFQNQQNGQNGQKSGKHHGLIHDTGEFLTRGGGPTGYLQAYIAALERNPLRVKILTSGALAGLQELMASYIAQDRSRDGNYFTSRVPKMMIYGAFISAPMGHFMIKILQWLFKDRTGLGSKIAMIAISNLIVAPIQNSIYLVSMAFIGGARALHQVNATVRAGFWPVMRVSWISSPIALAFAQAFLPPETWVPFFNLLAFVIGTYVNVITKKKRIAALRRKYAEERREYRSSESQAPVGPSSSFSAGGQGGGAASEYYQRSETVERRD